MSKIKRSKKKKNRRKPFLSSPTQNNSQTLPITTFAEQNLSPYNPTALNINDDNPSNNDEIAQQTKPAIVIPHCFSPAESSDMRNTDPNKFIGATERLQFQPFTQIDVDRFSEITSKPLVQKTDICFYGETTKAQAQDIIKHYYIERKNGTAYYFAIWHLGTKSLIGSVSIRHFIEFARGEIGFWLDPSFWNQGIGTEAFENVMRFGFGQLGCHKIHAQHFANNPASGRVMQKVGMSNEGILRQHIYRDGEWLDAIQYGILRSEFEKILQQKPSDT